jgi:hypothetical protein
MPPVSVSSDFFSIFTVADGDQSGEENRKKFGVSDAKMSERKKMWKDLNSF